MEAYRHKIDDVYCAVIYKNKKTGKLGLACNIHDEQYVRDWWNKNEPNYEIIEIKPLVNVEAFKWATYWDLVPSAYNNSEQRRKKFDFFIYVCGADLSEKYRDKANINEVKE